MSESKTLEQRVKELEEEKGGLEMALQNLIISICAAGKIDIPSVAKNYEQLNKALLEKFDFSSSAASNPMKRMQDLLNTQSEVIKENLGENYR
ncbi:hypothetical protein [Alcaligenes faecalis]|uniref:hypothetical protein n=1 Tax=Alcaligenes faecalis TaxID=511 RepID=UPI001EF14327|nr:hypothetical protein [Alcaligenes faecalis]ULH08236.1 hypothetical protein MF263_07225 [Alcaligenes faecalis]